MKFHIVIAIFVFLASLAPALAQAEESWLTGKLFAALETEWGVWLVVIVAIAAFAVVVYLFRTPSGVPMKKTIKVGPGGIKISIIYVPPWFDKVNFDTLRKQAENGDIQAQSMLGVIYYKRRDYAEAVKCWQLAAAQGEAKVAKQKDYLGDAGETEPGESFSLPTNEAKPRGRELFSLPPNKAGAGQWWWGFSAGQALAVARHNLGVAYYEGNGVPQNNAEATKWWHRAAEQGFTESKSALDILRKGG